MRFQMAQMRLKMAKMRPKMTKMRPKTSPGDRSWSPEWVQHASTLTGTANLIAPRIPPGQD